MSVFIACRLMWDHFSNSNFQFLVAAVNAPFFITMACYRSYTIMHLFLVTTFIL